MRTTTVLHRALVTGIGGRLAFVREAYDETQEQLAAALGVDRATVSSAEIERTVVGVPALVHIAQRYGLNIHWLASGRGTIFDASEGVAFLGNDGSARACRAAIRLMQGYQDPLEFCLVRYQPHDVCYSWIFRPHPMKAVVVLPGEEKPGPTMRALAELMALNHHCRGEIGGTNDEYAKVCERTLTLDDVSRILCRKPLRVEFPEFETWNLVLPSQRPVVEKALRELAMCWARPLDPADMIEEIGTLLKKHPHLAEPMLASLRMRLAMPA